MSAAATPSPADLLAAACDLLTRTSGRTPTHAAQAPGRVNLIGEHTDYALGYVLPIAIDRRTVAVGALAHGPRCRVFSVSTPVPCAFDLHTDPRAEFPPDHWGRYAAGVLALLAELPGRHDLPALDIALASSVPPGSGLSSSAALEVSIATLASALWNVPILPDQIARLCRSAEGVYAGVPCGIMDQMISACAMENHALLIDCRDERATPIPLPPSEEIAWVITDSGVRHMLGSSAFAERRAAGERAAAALGMTSLREATPWLIAESRTRLSDEEARCAVHVVSENHRVLEFVAALTTGDHEQAGRLMLASHASLRDDLRVSCPELDALVEAAMKLPGVFGSRMTGGGFGGCTVTLCRADAAAQVTDALSRAAARTNTIAHPAFIARAVGRASLLPIP